MDFYGKQPKLCITMEQIKMVDCQVGDCGKRFMNNDEAVEHFRCHSKLYRCSKCDTLFTTEQAVIDHFSQTHE